MSNTERALTLRIAELSVAYFECESDYERQSVRDWIAQAQDDRAELRERTRGTAGNWLSLKLEAR